MITLDNIPYIFVAFLLTIGLSGIFFNANLIKKVISLSIAQASILVLFISFGFNSNTEVPILQKGKYTQELYTNPLPSVLMLTAIVVGFAIISLALAIVVKVKEEEGTLDECEIN